MARAKKPIEEYSLLSMVERRIESVHATLKHVGKGMTNVSVAYLCAKLREAYLVDLLRSSADFFQICLDNFRKRSLLDDVLKNHFTKTELDAASLQKQSNGLSV